MTHPLYGEELILKASEIAAREHANQTHFFGGESYHRMHLEPIADIIRRLGYGAMYIASGFLHDVKEDTPITDEELASEGIPEQVIQSVNLLAKQKGQPHEEYIEGILSSPIATVSKFADSSFNYSWTILNSPDISDENFKQWSLEYAHNISVLRPALPSVDTV